MKLTDEQRAIIGLDESSPHWHDACEHGAENLVGSFRIVSNQGDAFRLKKYDLYVFTEHGRQEICIRYGDEPGDYISPGTPKDFVQTACLFRVTQPVYWRAWEILQATGNLKWEPKP
jgi:hypothetical protein